MIKNIDKRLLIISLILFINVTGNGLILPLLPFFADNLGASPITIGLFISTYPLFAILVGPLLGNFSDKYGRKPILLFSVMGTVIGFFLLGVAKTLPLLFLSRIIDGASAGNTSAARAAIADITPKDKRVSKLGYTFAAESLGLITGPLLGGLFAQYGFTVSANIAALIAAFAFLLTLFVLPETKDLTIQSTVEKKKIALDIKAVFAAIQNQKIRVFIAIVFLVQFLVMVMWGTLALYGKYLFDFSGKELGYISALAATIGILSQTILLNILLKITKEKNIPTLGLFTMSVGMLLLGTSNIVFTLLAGVGFMAMSFNILMPTVTGLASEFSSEDEQGNLMGTISSTTYLGSLLGPVIGNVVYTISIRGNYLVASVLALFTALVSIRGIHVRRDEVMSAFAKQSQKSYVKTNGSVAR